ncbi:23S rRNA (adenine(2503)-C(2))-methyltransferase RlmN [Candidatus Fonsibacter ubiquis]|uniref:23S rRNA (adenine(2503)-C(2))-methyltransferase RlmN n=1 Tax=Candidatus Fonsibacter ubiquis TaxID=1925548 RepID=UPI000C0843E7|nr:23S rRNA (adenine(2503)-C(2))-methyltransferase RlmN [Candidatus Fonsibacter ubiquis]
MSLKNFFDFNLQTLKQFLTTDLNIEEKKTSMRAKQLWQAVYKKGLSEFNHLTNLPIELRGELSSNISLEKPKIANTQKSSDGTIKWLIQLLDGNKVECVFIPEKTRGTLCISSQVGCTLNCRFCHTGTQRLVKNLNFSEIVNQVMIAKEQLNDWQEQKIITNIVLMGMGEPFYNYDNVKMAVEILKDKDGLNYGSKKITVSTAGIADKIPQAAREIRTYLALSLHAPTDEIRELIMPINKKFKIKDLIEQCKYYAKTVNEKITLEYVMLRGINDSKECAKQLTKIMAQFPCKVNLIEFNPWPGVNYMPTERKEMESFSKIIQDAGYVSTIRRSRGQDILGACGQLRTESQKRKFN